MPPIVPDKDLDLPDRLRRPSGTRACRAAAASPTVTSLPGPSSPVLVRISQYEPGARRGLRKHYPRFNPQLVYSTQQWPSPACEAVERPPSAGKLRSRDALTERETGRTSRTSRTGPMQLRLDPDLVPVQSSLVCGNPSRERRYGVQQAQVLVIDLRHYASAADQWQRPPSALAARVRTEDQSMIFVRASRLCSSLSAAGDGRSGPLAR